MIFEYVVFYDVRKFGLHNTVLEKCSFNLLIICNFMIFEFIVFFDVRKLGLYHVRKYYLLKLPLQYKKIWSFAMLENMVFCYVRKYGLLLC